MYQLRTRLIRYRASTTLTSIGLGMRQTCRQFAALYTLVGARDLVSTFGVLLISVQVPPKIPSS